MRYTLKQLKNLVFERLRHNRVNKLVDGYPVLHEIIIELRNEQDDQKRSKYRDLLALVLQHSHTLPDICDKHGRTGLSYVAACGDLKSVLLFLNNDADPNFIDSFGKKALEWAIFENPKAVELITFLVRKTEITDEMRTKFRELFQLAIEEENVDRINLLIDLKLVSYERSKLIAPPEKLSEDFEEGCWMRVISDPEKEFSILEKRSHYSDKELGRLRHKNLENDPEDPFYTGYSSATFVKLGMPICLPETSPAGVIIRRHRSQLIPYWYDGHTEKLTSHLDFSRNRLSNGNSEGEYNEVEETKIVGILSNSLCAKIKVEGQGRRDRYGVLRDHRLSDSFLPWNEGLFRYKMEDIIGIFLDPEDKESYKKALDLQRILRPDLGIYSYSCKGELRLVRSSEITEYLELSTPPTTSTQSTTGLFSGGGQRGGTLPTTSKDSVGPSYGQSRRC